MSEPFRFSNCAGVATDRFAQKSLNAERDQSVRLKLQQSGKFEVRMNAPGFEPGDVKVTALPDALIVKAASTHTHTGKEANVRFCEFGRKDPVSPL